MKTLSKLAIACMLLLSACAALRGWDESKLTLGMNKDNAFASMGQKPGGTIVAKQYPGGTLEVFEYAQSYYQADGTKGAPVKLWLYFFNNKLVEFGKPGNLEQEEDHILSMQNRQ